MIKNAAHLFLSGNGRAVFSLIFCFYCALLSAEEFDCAEPGSAFELLSAGVFAEVLSVVLSLAELEAELPEEADGIEVTSPSEPQPVRRKRESARTQARIAEMIFFMLIAPLAGIFPEIRRVRKTNGIRVPKAVFPTLKVLFGKERKNEFFRKIVQLFKIHALNIKLFKLIMNRFCL